MPSKIANRSQLILQQVKTSEGASSSQERSEAANTEALASPDRQLPSLGSQGFIDSFDPQASTIATLAETLKTFAATEISVTEDRATMDRLKSVADLAGKIAAGAIETVTTTRRYALTTPTGRAGQLIGPEGRKIQLQNKIGLTFRATQETLQKLKDELALLPPGRPYSADIANLELQATDTLTSVKNIVNYTSTAINAVTHKRRQRVGAKTVVAGLAAGVMVGLTAIPNMIKISSQNSQSSRAESGLKMFGGIVGLAAPSIVSIWETLKPENQATPDNAPRSESIPLFAKIVYGLEAVSLVATSAAQIIAIANAQGQARTDAGIALGALLVGGIAPAIVAFDKIDSNYARPKKTEGSNV